MNAMTWRAQALNVYTEQRSLIILLKTTLVKSKYEIRESISDELLTITYYGLDRSTNKHILIWKNKAQ